MAAWEREMDLLYHGVDPSQGSGTADHTQGLRCTDALDDEHLGRRLLGQAIGGFSLHVSTIKFGAVDEVMLRSSNFDQSQR
jgi:hypothetical protein